MTGLFPSLGILALLLAAASVAGVRLAAAFVPRGQNFTAERLGWGIALGLAAVGLAEGSRLVVSGGPAWAAFVAAAIAAVLLGRWFRLPESPVVPPPAGKVEPSGSRSRIVGRALLTVAAVGVLLYALRALTEPMRSNDFFAIWGLKAKALFAAGRLPAWLADPVLGGFSHPEYPFGLPLLLAGFATLMGQWEDQALGLVYPLFQAATVLVLWGWLRRRGAGETVAAAAAALVALFDPLYSSFLTGMAEIPVAMGMLLVGTSLSDALDDTDPGAWRRLAAASLLAASTKNEGLFFAVAAGGFALVSRAGRRLRLRAAGAAIVPALLVTISARVIRGPVPLRDFDFGLLAPSRLGELTSRLARAVQSDLQIATEGWPILACVAALLVCGRRIAWADRLIVVASISLLAYLALPAFAVLGPEWLAQTTLFRTTAALTPVMAAGIAGRYAPKSG